MIFRKFELYTGGITIIRLDSIIGVSGGGEGDASYLLLSNGQEVCVKGAPREVMSQIAEGAQAGTAKQREAEGRILVPVGVGGKPPN